MSSPEPFFVERHPQPPLIIEFHERIFKFTEISFQANVDGKTYDTGLKTNLWLDTGKSLFLDPTNVPVLSGAGQQLQIVETNSAEIKLLYEEALLLNLLDVVAENRFKITIVPLRKILNDDSVRNRWTVFRQDLIPAMGPLIGSKFMRDLRRGA